MRNPRTMKLLELLLYVAIVVAVIAITVLRGQGGTETPPEPAATEMSETERETDYDLLPGALEK